MDRNRATGKIETEPKGSLNDLDSRSRAIFREIVDTYLSTGEPVGSRTVSQRRGVTVSPATIRNVMSDLEHLGLLSSPHTSAGRIPTQLGLRMFVDALLEIGDITESERQAIAAQLAGSNKTLEDTLTQATAMLSGLSQCAGLVVTPTVESPLKHIEFLALGLGQALVVIVGENGSVENRVIDIPLGLTPSSLTEASNYLNTHLRGHTLSEARAALQRQIDQARSELDALTARLVEDGIALWAGSSIDHPQSLIVRGRANLLDNVEAAADLERVRKLFDDLESKNDLIQLMQMAREGEGVRIFIGSENKLFSLSGSSLIVSPYRDSEKKIIGVLGVIGPTRLNYARVIPLVDYTAKVIGKIVS